MQRCGPVPRQRSRLRKTSNSENPTVKNACFALGRFVFTVFLQSDFQKSMFRAHQTHSDSIFAVNYNTKCTSDDQIGRWAPKRPESSQRAPRELPESSQRVPREPPESWQRAPRELPESFREFPEPRAQSPELKPQSLHFYES